MATKKTIKNAPVLKDANETSAGEAFPFMIKILNAAMLKGAYVKDAGIESEVALDTEFSHDNLDFVLVIRSHVSKHTEDEYSANVELSLIRKSTNDLIGQETIAIGNHAS